MKLLRPRPTFEETPANVCFRPLADIQTRCHNQQTDRIPTAGSMIGMATGLVVALPVSVDMILGACFFEEVARMRA